jgi:DNA polymerase-3 subunit epsilon
VDLRSLPVLVLDCQSTGATPAHGSLLEVGWARGAEAPSSSLVALPEGSPPIGKHVKRITGIAEDTLIGAPPPEQVWAEVASAARDVALGDRAVAVIHFASFELRFLRALHEAHGDGEFPLDAVCTHEIAQRLFRDLPRRGLRPLAGYFGEPAGELRRAADHVRATQGVWRHLVEHLAGEGIESLEDLRAFVASSPRAKPKARGWPMPRQARRDLPDAPGVYRMQRIDGSLLYVGKATSLKKRVSQHFTRKKGMPDRALEMLSQARKLDVTRTETALEAALLEHDEIKAHDPPYNIALKADPTRIVFVSFDLRSIAPRPDARHVIGPIRDPRRVAGIVELAAELASPGMLDPAIALDMSPEWAPERAMFLAGVELFRAAHPIGSLRDLLALGATIEEAREVARSATPSDDPAARSAVWSSFGSSRGPEKNEEEVEGWTPEKVAEEIGDRLASASRAISRAKLLCVLSESSVSFVVSDRRRMLKIEDARITAREWQPLDALPPIPNGKRASERRAGLDLSGYDRLRVLVTELRACEDPIVRAGPRAIIRGLGLRRALARV